MAKILIVDDRPANREFLLTLLGYKGHRLLQAGDGAEALEVVRAERPDLVICDVLMPTMDGYEFVRQLRADREIAQIPVVFYTAHYREREAQNLAKAVGVSHVLGKPCEPELVLRVVDEALGIPSQPAPPLEAETFDTEHLRLVTDKLSETVQELQLSNERQAALIDLNLQLASQHDPLQLMNDVCRGARELLGARYGALRISGKETDPTAHFVSSGFNAESAAQFGLPPLDRGILGEVSARRSTRRLKNPGLDLLTIGLPAGFPSAHSLLAAPISSLSYGYGWICLTDKLGAEEFSAEDEQLLTILAAQAGRIYENGSLYAKVQRHAAELQQEMAERKRIEGEVRETRNFLASIFDNIPNSIFVKDARDLRFVRVNSACEKLTGYSEKEFLGKSDYDFFPKEQADFFVAKDRETLASSKRVFIVEESITSKDGTKKILQTKKFPILDKDGRSKYLLGMSEDITERKQVELRLQESETKYRHLIEQAPDGVFLSDRQGNYLLVNSRGCELLGYAEHEVVGMNAKNTYLEGERGIHTERLEQIRHGQTLRFERVVKRKDGSTFPAEISLKMLDAGTIQAIFHDITIRRNQEQKIARLSRIQAVLSGINSAIVRIRDRQELFNEACRIAVEHGGFSSGWIALLDRASGTLMPAAQAGLPMDLSAAGDSSNRSAGLVPGGTAEVALREKAPAFDNDIEANPGFLTEEMSADTLTVRRAAIRMGAKSVIVLPLFVGGQTFGILALYTPERNFFDEEELKLLTELAGDISFGLEYIAKEEKVDYLAYYDSLTGLPNRTLFFDRLTHQLGAARRDGLDVALVLMDLDRFRLVNDTLGRQAGDTLIGAVAHRVKEAFRDQDTVARVGADSFAVAVSGTWKAADAVARFLEAHDRQMFGPPFALGQEELRVSATAGVAVFPGDGNDPEVLFANAEAALRKAKEENARFLFYRPEMNARVADSLRMENRLRQALENGEMVLWYQPKLDVKTRKLTGFEALMRWQDAESGMVPPGKFIPLMEQTGLILDAGRWALLQVARDCGLWASDGIEIPHVAANVSPIQLRQKDFVTTVVEAAAKTEAAGSVLELEITESVIMENVEAIIPKLEMIRGLGVKISIDDFGTGYSSLAYIARLPIHALKIDRSFVAGMTDNQDSLAIVRSVISLAHSLRLNVIAEGVETEDQAMLLRGLECNEMQGYLFSRPVPPEDVPALVRKLA